MSVQEILGWVTSMLEALGMMTFISAMVIIMALVSFYHRFTDRR